VPVTLASTPGAELGPLGLPAPEPRFLGNEEGVKYSTSSGGRLAAGSWLNPDQSLGVEARGFLLQQGTAGGAISSDAAGNPAIFRPVNDVTLGQDTLPVSVPGGVFGELAVNSTARLWGAEANVLSCCYSGLDCRADLVGGMRYLGLTERLQIDQLSRDFGGLLPTPLLAVTDSFQTRNQFFAGQLGGQVHYQPSSESFFLDARAVLGLGATFETINISGTTTQARPGGPSTLPYGVLAGPGNSGHFNDTRFGVSPQVDIRIGYQPLNCLQVFVGYNFLYLNSVARPGDQINPNVDERNIPSSRLFTPGVPSASPPTAGQSEFWAQGISLGAEFRY
jgi:hypothetical protein